jgi:GT2 family glycosyltransferase
MTAELRPVVTVVVPMLNEIGFIEDCLDGFAKQTYPHDRLDVVIVDGGSSDGSRRIADGWATRYPWVRVISNDRRKASAAFNRGVQAAAGDIVCLFSAHGVPDADFVERSVEVLRDTGAAGVGGRYLHIGRDRVSNAIGLAMVSPFGMASPHRFAARRSEVDTISHPAYRKEWLDKVGLFDETLERNSDYELNWRIRAAGGNLVFDPSIGSIYRPRGSLGALARQFWWYGRWKVRVARRHPRSLRPRHLVAPAAVIAAAASPALLARRRSRGLVALAGLAYMAATGAATASARPRAHDASVPTLFTAFPVMHATWGSGFVVSIIEDLVRR